MSEKRNLVISLGGSLIVPDRIDIDFLRAFRQAILCTGDKFERVYIVCGGGKTSREYVKVATALAPDISDEEKDWLGIQTGCLNGYLLKLVFRKCSAVTVVNPTLDQDQGLKYCQSMGVGPNHSSDFIAVQVAKKYGVREILNLTNIKFVYDRDPAKDSQAKPLAQVSWSRYRQIIGAKWIPGGNFPFDPVASQAAARAGLKVYVMDGRELDGVNDFLTGRGFVGTVIG